MRDTYPKRAAYDIAGPDDAPVIVLVHGSVVTRTMWLPQVRALSDTHRVLAPDLPGHGALAAVPFTRAAAVQILADLIELEARGRALVAGLSLGGYVAMELAYQRPDLVAGLVLSGCSVNFTGITGLYLKTVGQLMRRGWLWQSREKAEQRTRRLFPPALADVAEAQLQAGVYPDALGQSFVETAGIDFVARLAQYPGPGLLLNGERDRPSRRSEARFLAAMQRGQLQVISDAGHACTLDQPDAYNRAVRNFAQSIGWTSSWNDRS